MAAKTITVIGGGFAGLEAAIQLRKRGFAVTLISDRDYLFVYPISIWVPTGGIAFDDVCAPLAPLAEQHGFELVVDRVIGADFKRKTLHLEGGERKYDVLVFAVGAGKTKAPGVEHTYSTCGAPSASLAIHERYQALVAEAEVAKREGRTAKFSIGFGFGGNPKDKSAVRGGPVFEVLFNVRHDLKKRGLLDAFELSFFAPMPRPGAKMGDDAPERLEKWITGQGMGWKVGTKITRFDERGVAFADGSRLDTDLTIYVPANAGHPLAQTMGLPVSDAGFVLIDQHCRVEGHDDLWAIGDAARLEGPEWKAKQGHVAEAMGKIVAHNLDVLENGREEALQGYGEHLSILCVMDTGDGATIVYRDDETSRMVPAPVVGHWMKKAWGTYWKKSKAEKMPRLPGM